MNPGHLESDPSTITGAPFNFQGVPESNLPTILCCLCGASIKHNPANMCANCLQQQVDITEGISKQLTMFCCRGCGRYSGTKSWVAAEIESRQLLALCLKRVKGLDKVKMTDAAFVWTEPHSKRIKIKLTVQKEVMTKVILQQTFIVEFVLQNQQCPTCQKSYTDHTWSSCVQVRQKVDHKKTFLFLEQLILRHGMTSNVHGIKEFPGGLDFYYGHRSHGQHLLDFLQSVVPVHCKTSKRLVSQDFNNNVANYKHTLYAEISPVCKDDLVVLPPSITRKAGGVPPLMFCYSVSSILHFLDPVTFATVDVHSGTYWRNPFRSICNSRQLVEFVIMDCELTGQRKGKWRQATVTCARSSDFGVNDTQFECITHLGHLLNAGDTCLGFDLTVINFNDEDIKHVKVEMPEVLLVRKSYPKRQKRRFKLKRMTVEKPIGESVGRKGKEKDNTEAMDEEEFLRDLEEDTQMRSMINMYKSNTPEVVVDADDEHEEDDQDGTGDLPPKIELSELLDEMHLSTQPPHSSAMEDKE